MTPEQLKILQQKYSITVIQPLKLGDVQTMLTDALVNLASADLAECFAAVVIDTRFAVIRNDDASANCEKMAADLRASGVRTGKIVDGEIRWD